MNRRGRSFGPPVKDCTSGPLRQVESLDDSEALMRPPRGRIARDISDAEGQGVEASRLG